jgi:molecular chaperone HtpG
MQESEGLKVQVIADKDNNTITVKDNGIGMDYDDLVNNLGTIASSGTQKFLQNVTENSKTGINLIGQFGVGFYSAFMVAGQVTVTSRKAGQDKTFIWQSNGEGEYTVATHDKVHERGTAVTLKLRPQEVEYLEKHRLKHIITTYSDHISFPIELIDSDKKAEIINTASALWIRPKSQITDEQYNEFYHHVAHLPDTPWTRLHTKAEGNIEYTSLLYIPSIKPFDLFHPDRKSRVKLYVKRVFITDDAVKMIPAYMRFLRGVVDSEDLPLNINRETLQDNIIIEKIRKSLVKKVLSELKSKAKDDKKSYREFWNNFGEVMKEGLCEPALEEKEQLLEVCRFHSTKSGDDLVSLDEYIEHMAEGQDVVYYITGDNLEALKKHPQLEGFIKRDIEVLLLADHVDDFWVHAINQYKNKELKSVNAPDINLEEIKKTESTQDEKKDENAQNKLIGYIKEVLSSKIKEVKVSSKLVDSPACLAVPLGAMSIRMEKYLMDQKQLKTTSAKILEINPNHPILKKIASDITNDNTGEETKDLVNIIYDQACIMEGQNIADPTAFMRRVNHFLSKNIA